MKAVKLIKVYANGTLNNEGEHFFDMFTVQQSPKHGDDLSPLQS
jgi:hypothetical protein